METAVIPAGARHIRVEEVAGAPNYLALKSPNGKYYLNGHWYIQWSGEYEAAGTTVFYTRKHNKETFVAQGPTSEEMHIMVSWLVESLKKHAVVLICLVNKLTLRDFL